MTDKKHGPWTIVKRNLVYQDPWIRLEQDDVIRPDGAPGSYCVAHVKPGVCVLAVGDGGQCFLTREFHYGVGRVTVECVSGGIDEGESVATTAKRELIEELGIRAATWVELGCVDPFTANVVSPTSLFLTMGLAFEEAQPEGTELIERVSMPINEAVRQVLASEITHAPSCDLILRAAIHLGKFTVAAD